MFGRNVGGEDGEEDGDKDGGNSTGMEYFLQVNFTVNDVIWKLEMRGDRVHAKITRGTSSSGSQTDCGDEETSYYERSD